MLYLIDKINKKIGYYVSWLVIFMVIATFINVANRYIFNSFSIYLGEFVIIANIMIFLLYSPLLLRNDKHVRVDIFFCKMSERGKAIVDMVGTIFLLFTLCFFVIYYSWGYVLSSWQQLEESGQTGGLPGLYLVKSLLLLTFILLALQGLTIFFDKIKIIKNR